MDTKTKVKAKVFYSLDNRVDHKSCVTMYAKTYKEGDYLQELFRHDFKDDTCTMTDYFETGRVVLFPGHPFYKEARVRAEVNQEARK